MRVIIAGSIFSFPYGHGAANRVKLLAKAMKFAGIDVQILLLKSNNLSSNTQNKGQFEGIDFEYATGKPLLPKSFIKRRYFEIKGLMSGLLKIANLFKRGKIDALYLYDWSPFYSIPLIAYSRIAGLPVILNLDEWPPTRPKFGKYKSQIFEKFILFKVNAIIPISTYLYNKAVVNKRSHIPQLKVPILVDPEKWSNEVLQKNSQKSNYLLWSGDANNYIEPVKFLIDILQELINEGYRVKLKIAGDISEHSKRIYIDYIKEKEVDENFLDFLGFISEELKNYYNNATALLIPLSNAEKDMARFPTKIGEYLASGRPVVSSDIGEFAIYATNDKDAILCDFNDPVDFASGIKKLIDNPQFAEKIGRNGRNLCLQEFDYRVHGKRLYHFIESRFTSNK